MARAPQGTRAFLAETLRRETHIDVLAALDTIEPLHRTLGTKSAEDVGLEPEPFSELQNLARTAYETLCSMQKITDPDYDRG